MTESTSLRDRADILAQKMNKLTESLDLSGELIVSGDELIELVEEKTQEVMLHHEVKADDPDYAAIMNLSAMTEDFMFVRETLREITDNARRVQGVVTLELLDADTEQRAALILSFSELSKAITDAQKLFVLSYKDMSSTLLNLNKMKKDNAPALPGVTTNNLNVYTSDPMSTADILKRLRSE